MRVFFALMPPPAVASALAVAATSVDLPHARRLAAADLHVTLAFVGQIDAPARVACERAASAVEGTAFELVLDHAGHFERARVAWLGPRETPPALVALAANCVRHSTRRTSVTIRSRSAAT